MKTCSKCGELKPEDSFHKDSYQRSGLRTSCKACQKIAKQAYRLKNPEKDKIYNAAWRAENPEKAKLARDRWAANNPVRKKAANDAWRFANPEKQKAATAAWRIANPEKVRAYDRARAKSNPERVRVSSHNRRASKKSAIGKLSVGLSEKLFKLQKGKCSCCGLPLGDDYHLDHIMPLALGGKNDDSNMQLLRAKCNLQKSAKHPVEFMQSRGFLL